MIKVNYHDINKSIDEKYDKWWMRILMKICFWFILAGSPQGDFSRRVNDE